MLSLICHPLQLMAQEVELEIQLPGLPQADLCRHPVTEKPHKQHPYGHHCQRPEPPERQAFFGDAHAA